MAVRLHGQGLKRYRWVLDRVSEPGEERRKLALRCPFTVAPECIHLEWRFLESIEGSSEILEACMSLGFQMPTLGIEGHVKHDLDVHR